MRECKECKTLFEPTVKHRFYCSEDCFNKNRLKLKRKYGKDFRKKYPEKVKEQRKKWLTSEKGKKTEERYYKRTKIKRRICHREWSRRQRLEIIRLLGGQCTNPYSQHKEPYIDVRALQIDHVNGGGRKEVKKFKNCTTSYYSFILKKIKSGSKDYQLLCANCNWIKKYENNESKNIVN